MECQGKCPRHQPRKCPRHQPLDDDGDFSVTSAEEEEDGSGSGEESSEAESSGEESSEAKSSEEEKDDSEGGKERTHTDVFKDVYSIWELFEDIDTPRKVNQNLPDRKPPVRVKDAYTEYVAPMKLDRFTDELFNRMFRHCEDNVPNMELATDKFPAIAIANHFFVFDGSNKVQELRYHPDTMKLLDYDTAPSLTLSQFAKQHRELKVHYKENAGDKKRKTITFFKWIVEHHKQKRRISNSEDRGEMREGLIGQLQGRGTGLDIVKQYIVGVVNSAAGTVESAVGDESAEAVGDGTVGVAGNAFQPFQLGNKIVQFGNDRQLYNNSTYKNLNLYKEKMEMAQKQQKNNSKQSYNRVVNNALRSALGDAFELMFLNFCEHLHTCTPAHLLFTFFTFPSLFLFFFFLHFRGR